MIPALGYGNDSRQTGPLSSRILHTTYESEFAFCVIRRTRRLRGRGAAAPRISRKAGFFRVFCRLPVICLFSRKANRVRGCRPITNSPRQSPEQPNWVTTPSWSLAQSRSRVSQGCVGSDLRNEWSILSRIVAIPDLRNPPPEMSRRHTPGNRSGCQPMPLDVHFVTRSSVLIDLDYSGSLWERGSSCTKITLGPQAHGCSPCRCLSRTLFVCPIHSVPNSRP